jgi:hypothetical protein
MSVEEAKAYVNKRYHEILEDNPEWLRCQISNLIIIELRDDHDFTLTLPTGQVIVSVSEDGGNLTFAVMNQVG